MNTMKLLHIIIFAALTLIGVGCSSPPSTVLYQSIGATKATVDSTLSLYQSGTITKADAQAAYTGAVAAESAEKLWDAGIVAGNTTTAASTGTVVNADLANLLAQLQAVQTRVPVPVSATRRSGVKFKTAGPAKQLAPTAVISLVELAIQLAPEIESLFADLFTPTAVTEDQIAAEFSALDVSLANLATALNQ